MTSLLSRAVPLVFAIALSLLLPACSLRQALVGNLADELAAQGQSDEADLELAREASAFYLKLSESVLQQDPAHVRLAESVAAGFTRYAYAFVAFEADRVEATDVREAARLRVRAAKLYARAHQHAIAALAAVSPGLRAQLADPASALTIAPEHAGLAYWAAASWGGLISLSKDDPDVVADLPLAARLAALAWQADPAWGEGALTGLVGSFEASRPGGSRARALAYFDASIAQSGGRRAGALVTKAENHALPAGDQASFEALLREALVVVDAGGGGHALENEVMGRRARWLLERVDELF